MRGGPGGGMGGGCSRMNGMSDGNGGSQSISGAMGFNSNSGNTDLANQALANRMMASQMMANRAQAMGGCQNSSGTTNSTANVPQARATAAQFAQKAMSFDADGDGELNQNELTQVATAVIDELQLRQQRSGSLASNSFFRIKRDSALDAASTTTQMTAAFVAKSLTYDKDHNGTLDNAETRALANALIRTLS